LKHLILAVISTVTLFTLNVMAETPTEALKKAVATLGPATVTDTNYNLGSIQHIVLFRYADNVTDQQKEEVKKKFLALQQLCVRDGKQYIRSIETGTQNSGEGFDQQFEQAFIVTFKSEGDRNYYVGQPVITDAKYYDSHHQAFKDSISPDKPVHPSGVFVFDFKIEEKTRRAIVPEQ